MKTPGAILVCAVGAAALASACGGSSGPAGGRERDGESDGREGGADASAQCPLTPGLAPEPPPAQITLDGGVPLAELPYALAVARCSYWSRCFGLATYVDNECIDTLAGGGVWFYQSCGQDPYGTLCVSSGMYYDEPTPALLQAAAAGVVRYDPQREGLCVAALMAEECLGSQLVEGIPACAGVFTCAANSDAGDAGPTDGDADSGTGCGVLPETKLFVTCTSDDDCVGLADPQGPYCAHGVCADSPCGVYDFACTAFAPAGQPCDTNAPSVLDREAPSATGTCAPALACHFAGSDGGLGTCVVTQDVGGSCADVSFCKPGLACTCGSCQIPPSTGPCADGLCKVGVAYCDINTSLCQPVRGLDASCTSAINSCGPGLNCDTTAGTCQRNPNYY